MGVFHRYIVLLLEIVKVYEFQLTYIINNAFINKSINSDISKYSLANV